MTFSPFEAGMIICFGAAWPFSIWKSFTSRSNKGKSLHFIIIVNLGYLFGMLHKIIYSFDLVIILYGINFLMVTIDILLYIRNIKYTENGI